VDDQALLSFVGLATLRMSAWESIVGIESLCYFNGLTSRMDHLDVRQQMAFELERFPTIFLKAPEGPDI